MEHLRHTWLLSLMMASACGSTDTPMQTVDASVPLVPPQLPLADKVVVEPGATPEALTAMLAKTPEFWEWSAGRVQTPTDGDDVGRQAAAEFRWWSDIVHLDKDAETEAPMSGPGYLLLFSAEDGTNVAAVFTKAKKYTPSGSLWAELSAQKGPITVHVNSADFQENKLAQFGGPFFGSGITFTVAD